MIYQYSLFGLKITHLVLGEKCGLLFRGFFFWTAKIRSPGKRISRATEWRWKIDKKI